MEEDKLSVEEFEDIFGNTPFENIKKIRKYIKENYIPKSKIKEKIESISGLKNSKNYTEKILTNFVIDILEDLLED